MPFELFGGIDPGQSGGVTILNKAGKIILSEPMPGSAKELSTLLKPYSKRVHVYVEQVHSFPGQGVASSFKFGLQFGLIQGVLGALNIPHEFIRPRDWQKKLRISPSKKNESRTNFKNRLKTKAMQLFPQIKITLSTADALLIAEVCRRERLFLK